MGGESPNVILYDVNGQEMSVSNGSAIPAGTSALMIAGSDGTNSRFITLDSSGRQLLVGAGVAGTPAGGVLSIQGVTGGTSIPISINTPDVTATGSLGALNAAVPIALAGTSGVAMQLVAGSLVGTIVPEISFDGGTTWVGTFFDDPTTGNKVSSIVFASNNTATARTLVSADGASNMRVRVSLYTSGTATANLRGSSQNEPSVLFSGTAGGVLPPTIAQMGGTDGANLRAMSTDTSGHPVIVGPGTAGTPSGGVVTIQGVSGGTVVPGNITQFGGVNISTGTGASGTGIPRVTVANDSNILATQSGTWTVAQGAANTLANKWPVQITDGTNTMPTADTATRALFEKITDGTNTAAVKAASTAAAAADPSLVVGLSPNSPLPTGTNNIGSVNNVQTAESIAAWTSSTTNNTALALTVTGYGSVTVTLNQGTTITGGAVTFEGSDTVAGTNWYPISMVSTAGATVPVSTYTLVASTNVAFQTNVAGFIQFRVRLSPAISGTGTVNVGIAANASATEWQQATYITDGTHGPVTVKAASTAPVATDQALVVVLSPNQAAIPVTNVVSGSVPGNSPGYITLATVTNTAQQATTYTEQSANFTGSVKSSSVSDASAGTGARTMVISYVDATGATAGTETVTLNGTTAVNLVTTTKCFIEKIVVATVGSGGSNAGTISLFTGAAGAGTTVVTIAIGDNQTYLGHHYVVSGKTCNITGITGINNSTSQNTVFTLQSITLPVANQPSVQVSDWVSGSQTQQIVRLYDQLIKVPGPARIQLFGANGGTPSIKSQGSFDYYDA